MGRTKTHGARADLARANPDPSSAIKDTTSIARSRCLVLSLGLLAVTMPAAFAQTTGIRLPPPSLSGEIRNQVNDYIVRAPEGSGGEADPIRADDRSLRKVMGSIPGESINELTGELSLSMVDLSLRGTAGMDLTIGRTRRTWFTDDERVRHKFERHDMDTIADWRLDIPHIRLIRTSQSAFRRFNSNGTVNESLTGSFSGVCGNFLPPVSFYGDTAENLGAMQWRAPELVGFTGQPTRTLMYLARNTSIGDQVPASSLLEGATYVTADHWKISCDFSQYAPSKRSKFIARSPDGMRYEFDEPSLGSQDATYPQTPDGFLRKYPTYLRVYVTRITDRNGNWIAFQYKNLRPAAERDLQDFAYVERITTSDGREVSFDWELEPTCATPNGCITPANLPKRFAPTWRLRSFTHDKRTWTFNYNKSSQADPELTNVVLPDGSAWQYTISHDIRPDRIPHRYTVTFPKGGRVEYFLNTKTRPLPNLQTTAYQVVEYKVEYDGLGNAYDTTYCKAQANAAAAPKMLIVERKACSLTGPGAGACVISARNRSRLVTFAPQVLESSGQVRWDEGLPLSEQLFEGSLLINGSASQCPALAGNPVFLAPVLETKSYSWERRPLRFSFWRFNNNRDADFYFPDAANYWRVPVISTVNRSGWGTFQTRQENYDDLGFPQTIRHSLEGQPATAANARVLEQSYDHRLGLSGAPWVIGLPDVRRVLEAGVAISTVDNTYDSLGRLESSVKDGTTTQTTYSPAGDVATQTDVRGQVTTLSDHRFGIAQRVSFPPVKGVVDVETRVVSARGNIESMSNARLNRTSYAYDQLDRLKAVSFEVGSPMAVAWSTDGRTKTMTRGRRTDTFQLDGFGRIMTENVVDSNYPAEAISRAYRYDGFGRLVFKSLPASTPGGATSGFSYDFDGLDRLISTLRTSDGSRSHITYSAAETKTVTDFGNRTRTFAYRGFGAPSEEQMLSAVVPFTNRITSGAPVPASISTSFVRDYLGFATAVSQGGVIRRFKLDSRRLLEREYSPELGDADAAGFNVGYCRDDAGQVLGKSIGAACTTPSTAQLMSAGYDARSRLTTIDYRDPSTSDATYELTPTNNVKRITRGASISEFDYEASEQLKSQIVSLDGYRFVFGFEYDTLNNIRTVVYPSGRRQEVVSDALGRTRSIAGVIQSVAYSPSGTATSVVYANGQTTAISITPRAEIDSIVTSRAGSPPAVALNYDYDVNGNVELVTDSVNLQDTMALTYNELDQLASTRYPSIGLAVFWRGYDGAGNTMFDQSPDNNLSFAYDASNRLASVSGSLQRSMTYDQLGNMISDGARSFSFSADGTMRSSTAPLPKQFAYDGKDRLLKTVVAGVVRYTVYVGEQLMFEYFPASSTYIEYSYLGEMLVGSRHVTDAGTRDSDGDGVVDALEFRQ